MRTRLLATATALSLPLAVMALGTAPAYAGSGVDCGNYPSFGDYSLRTSQQNLSHHQVKLSARLTRDGNNCSERDVTFHTKTGNQGEHLRHDRVGHDYPSLGLASEVYGTYSTFTWWVTYDSPNGRVESPHRTVARR